MIVFVLVPGLYAAVEQADNPALRGRPVVVGADPAKRGTVTSASREARARGVHDGMETKRALELCPDAVLRPTRIVASLCARHAGPGGIRKVEEPDVADFLAPFPVTEIWGLGPATAERLSQRGVHTIAALRAVAPDEL